MIRYPTLPFVPGAIALGHLLGYAVAHPDASHRTHALAHHGHLWVVLAVGGLSALFGLAALVHARTVDRRSVPRYGRLAQLGALGFWLLEVAERLAHGTVAGLATEPALWWGLLLQSVVAALLLALARAAAQLGVRFAPRRPAGVVSPRRVRSWTGRAEGVTPTSRDTTANRRRGPPLPAA